MGNFDVVVVGAGPAGSTAAFLLAGAGMRVALVDKSTFPRDKLCGGLLSGRTKKVYKSVFGDGWQDLYEFTSSGARFFYKARLLNEVDDYRELYFTRREPFDHYLIQLAVKKGATLREKTGAISVEREDSSVRLSDGTRLRGDFIIGADGVTSRTARDLGLSLGKDNLALGLEIEYPRQGRMADLARPEIHFGIVRWGYGWVFPKKESLTIGIAGLANKNASFGNDFRAFLKQVCHDVPDIRWRGHPIPFCRFRLRPGLGNILLAGDAAGFVEPVTGEGIAFAMESAKHAAYAVLDAAGSGNPQNAWKHYQHRCEKLARFLTQAERMRHLVFPALSERLFAKALEKSKSVIYRYMDLAWDDMDYADYFNFLVNRLWRHLIHLG
jgi:geranylgeranyl reductase family protein